MRSGLPGLPWDTTLDDGSRYSISGEEFGRSDSDDIGRFGSVGKSRAGNIIQRTVSNGKEYYSVVS